jgi:hypothetical protein
MSAEGVTQLDSLIHKGNAYLEAKKERARALFNGADEGKFAREYQTVIEQMLPIAEQLVDESIVAKIGNVENPSNDFKALRLMLVADKLWELMADELEQYQSGKIPPSNGG